MLHKEHSTWIKNYWRKKVHSISYTRVSEPDMDTRCREWNTSISRYENTSTYVQLLEYMYNSLIQILQCIVIKKVA